MLRRSAAAEFACEIASPRALFFWPGHPAVRRAESTEVPGDGRGDRASVNALGRRFDVGTGPPRSPSYRDRSGGDMNILQRLLRLLLGEKPQAEGPSEGVSTVVPPRLSRREWAAATPSPTDSPPATPSPPAPKVQASLGLEASAYLPITRQELKASAHGSVAGRSILSNAAPHCRHAVVVNMDLKGFFPSIGFPRVRSVFQRLGYSPAVALILALLCTECPRRTVVYDGVTYHVATGPRGLPRGLVPVPASPTRSRTAR